MVIRLLVSWWLGRVSIFRDPPINFPAVKACHQLGITNYHTEGAFWRFQCKNWGNPSRPHDSANQEQIELQKILEWTQRDWLDYFRTISFDCHTIPWNDHPNCTLESHSHSFVMLSAPTQISMCDYRAGYLGSVCACLLVCVCVHWTIVYKQTFVGEILRDWLRFYTIPMKVVCFLNSLTRT